MYLNFGSFLTVSDCDSINELVLLEGWPVVGRELRAAEGRWGPRGGRPPPPPGARRQSCSSCPEGRVPGSADLSHVQDDKRAFKRIGGNLFII